MSGTGVSTTTGSFDDTFDFDDEYYQTVRHGNHRLGLSTLNLGASRLTLLGITTTLPSAISTPVLAAVASIESTLLEPLMNLIGTSLGTADIMAVDPLICNAPTLG
jgi:uncharacterized membrane protein